MTFYESEVELLFFIEHIIDFTIAVVLFMLFIWQILSEKRKEHHFELEDTIWHETMPTHVSRSSFTHLVHRLGVGLSVIYILKNIDPFALAGVFSWKIITFLKNNLILIYLTYGLLLIYAPVQAQYYHRPVKRQIILFTFVSLILVNIVFTNFASWYIFDKKNGEIWGEAFTIYWVSWSFIICITLILLLQYVYGILTERKNAIRLSYEETVKNVNQLRNLRRMQFTVILALIILSVYCYFIFQPSVQLYAKPNPQVFDLITNGFSNWAFSLCLGIILYQSWITLDTSCCCGSNTSGDLPLIATGKSRRKSSTGRMHSIDTNSWSTYRSSLDSVRSNGPDMNQAWEPYSSSAKVTGTEV